MSQHLAEDSKTPTEPVLAPPRPARRRRPRSVPQTALRTALVACIAILLNIPLLGAILTSLKSVKGINSGAFSFGFGVTLTNFGDAFNQLDLSKFLTNSIIISLSSIVIVIAVCYPAAFAIARLSFGGRTFLGVITSLRLLPAIFFVLPIFLLFSRVHLIDSRIALILVNVFVNISLALLLLVSAFRDMPQELEESALIDGCGTLRMLAQVFWSLLGPSLVAVSLLTFMFTWSEYLFGVILTSSNATPVTVGTANFVTGYGVAWGPLSAATFIAVLPPAILAITLPKFLVTGLTAGAVKG